MEPIDVDDIIDLNFPEFSESEEAQPVEVVFKDGTTKVFSGSELPEVLEALKHWTPPTA